MTLRLRTAAAADAPAMTSVWAAAFINDLIAQNCFPPTPQVLGFWLSSIQEEMAQPSSHFLVVVDGPEDDAPVVAYGKWNGPDAEPSLELPPQWPSDGNGALATEFFGGLAEKRVGIMGTGEGRRRHWYLELLVTRPEYQGKGAGGKIIRWGLEKTDEDGLEAYVEASPEGSPIYRHLGFEEISKVSVLDGRYTDLIMIRKIKGGK